MFMVVTSNSRLIINLWNTSMPSARDERWVLCMQSYSFQVVYCLGKTNIADALLRLNSLDQKNTNGEQTDPVKMIAEERMPHGANSERSRTCIRRRS